MPDGSKETVLVTGGTGFVGGWCIAELLKDGYAVRTTVRDLQREPDVRAHVEAAGADAADRLSVLAADLASEAGWEDAVAGCAYVLHVASPFPPKQPDDPDELIAPARDGALRVLRAALDAGVQRIVMTSSIAAAHAAGPTTPDAPSDESAWTDGSDESLTPYTRSKAIAEKAAWDLVRSRDVESSLATINPGAIIGPVLSEDRSYSLQAIERLLGGMPAVPRLGFTFVDVRDVARLHILAMTDPAAGGERFLAVDRFLWMKEVADILRDRLGPDGPRVPRLVAPNFVIRAMALVDPSVRTVIGDLGRSSAYSSAKARTQLGWSPRPVEDSIADTARSLLDRGIV